MAKDYKKLKGTGYNQISLPNLSPEQQQMFSDMINRSKGGIEKGTDFYSRLASGDPSMFEQLEAPAHQQFQEKMGNMASRFSGAGMGARHSSGFQNAASGEAANFAEKLQSQRMGLQQGAADRMMDLYSQIMGTKTHENVLTEEEQPWWVQFLQGLAPGLGKGLGSFGSAFGLKKAGLM